MKLHLNTFEGQNSIASHAPGQVSINGLVLQESLIVLPDKLFSPWKIAHPTAISFEDFGDLLAVNPELVIFGSGTSFRFPDPSIATAFSRLRIGFEVMDTAAACRTYNVLISEGRYVAAALIIE